MHNFDLIFLIEIFSHTSESNFSKYKTEKSFVNIKVRNINVDENIEVSIFMKISISIELSENFMDIGGS